MEEKKITVQDGNYICDIDVSVEEWKNILQDEKLMLSTYKDVLIKFYNEPEHKSTCKALSEKYNEHPQHFNSIITNFAVAVQRKLNRFNVIRIDGAPAYWIIPMTGRDIGKHFEWTMRPELVQAMEEILKNMNETTDIMKQQYFIGGYTWGGGTESHLDRFIADGVWENGYEDSREELQGIFIRIKKGDYFALKSTFIKNKKSYLKISKIGIVSQIVNNHTLKIDWLDTPVFELTNISWYAKTLVQITKKEDIDKIFGQIIKKDKMNNYKQLLENNKNLILTGAPGTGKTYKTAEIALQIVGKTDIDFSNRKIVMEEYKKAMENGLICFTTFHQSLDYEEFIEGLKPDIDESGQMTYIVKPGIFKNICEKAKKNFIASQKSEDVLRKEENLNAFVEKFLDDAIENDTEFETIFHKIKYKITGVNDVGKIELYASNFRNGEQKKPHKFLSRNELLKLLENENKYENKVDAVKILSRNVYVKDNYLYSLYSEIYESFKNSTNKVIPEIKKIEEQNYVLIIDEINRGNISKIFGELITLLEKDKRLGEENEITVTLPYSPESVPFGVPPNLYIIGTMNTADRSIGHIDYAIRRRFAFFTVKADQTVIKNYPQYEDDTKQKALDLFDNIQKFISDNINEDLDADDLMIGHSYFLCKTTYDLKRRLEYEIIPLIKEYEKDGIIMVDSKEKLAEKFTEWRNLIS